MYVCTTTDVIDTSDHYDITKEWSDTYALRIGLTLDAQSHFQPVICVDFYKIVLY